MPVVFDKAKEFLGSSFYWIEPYGDENLARVRQAVEERDAIANDMFEARFQDWEDGGRLGKASIGIPKNEVVFPRQSKHFAQKMVLKKGAFLPEFVEVGYQKGGVMVSRKMRAVIEQHEAAGTGFQFHPVTIVLPDGTVFSEDYVFWDIYRRVDAIDPAVGTGQDNVDLSLGNHRWNRISLQSKEKLAEGPQKRWVFKSAIGDAAVWSDFRYGVDLCMPIWVTDALWADMNAADLTGFSAASTWGEI